MLGEALGSGKWADFRLEYDVEATSGPNVMPKGKATEQFNGWEWQDGEARVDVDFDPKTKLVRAVGCFVKDPNAAMDLCKTVGSVSAGDSEDHLVAKIGEPNRVEYDKRSPTKTCYFNTMGLEVYLEKRRVYFVKKLAPGDAGFLWWLRSGRL